MVKSSWVDFLTNMCTVTNLSAVGCQLKYRDKAGGIRVTGESANESGDKGKIWPH